MSRQKLFNLIRLLIAGAICMPAIARGGDYRGMSAGWPPYANGYYAANYPANYGSGAAYYVARPVAAASYGAAPRTGAMYVPTTAAYSNPAYFAAYGRSPVAYRPVATAAYAPATAAYYAPTATYYAPTTANYAPANSYAVTPAGLSSAGSEAAAYYGQPYAMNYVPPRVAYRPTYAAVPVYMYRPVTSYDPITAQPVTCLQPTTTSQCQPTTQRCGSGSNFSWLNPLTWFRHDGCRSSGCGAPAPTTAYCGTAACGQPYYPVQPGIPVVPAPTMTAPPTIITPLPSGGIPAATPRIPSPPTRYPANVLPSTTFPSTTLPADVRPSLTSPPPSSFSTPIPSGPLSTPLPGTAVPVAPGPGGSFQTTPQPGFGAPSFGTGTNYAPAVDPYSSSSTIAPPSQPLTTTPTLGGNVNAATERSTGPSHSVFGSGYHSGSNEGVIRAPELGPALPPNVQTVPDPDATRAPKAINHAPALLDPRDKTAARGNQRWAVVAAVWPSKPSPASQQLSDRPVSTMKSYAPHQPTTIAPQPTAATFNPADYNDSGWKTAVGF